MIRSHAVHTRSFGVREILIQSVKLTWPCAVQLRVLYKSNQAKIVSEQAKFTLVVEGRLEACYFSSSNLPMAGKNISTVKYTQHLIAHCSIYSSWINSLKCRVQILWTVLTNFLITVPCVRVSKSEKFSDLFQSKVINFVNEVYGF